MQNRDVDGYELFDDVTDKELQVKNRATTMINIMEDNLHRGGTITEAGLLLTLQYWNLIEDKDKGSVYDLVAQTAIKKGMLDEKLL